MAKLLLEHGALQPEAGEEQSGPVYQGLNIGGKKMAWAMDYDQRNKIKSSKNRPTAVHLAAAFDQPASIDFLVKEAPAIYDRVKAKVCFLRMLFTFCKSNKTKGEDWPDFKLSHGDKLGRTALVWAVLYKKINAAKKLIQLSRSMDPKLLDNGDKDGITPLMFACDSENVDMVQELTKAGANITATENLRGWNSLHFSIDAPKVVEILLPKLDKKAVNHPSKKYGHTPLMYAIYRNIKKTCKLV
jgi:ankyrin repeat protein